MGAKVNHTQTMTDTWRVDADSAAFGLELGELRILMKHSLEARPNSSLRAVVNEDGRILSLTVEMANAMSCVLPPG